MDIQITLQSTERLCTERLLYWGNLPSYIHLRAQVFL